MADIVIINPRLEISFWGTEHCIGLLGKRANLPVACLALLAALLAELEGFRHAGLSIIFVVDDNLIGNKKAIKPPYRNRPMLTDLSRHHRQPEIMDDPELPPARFAETLKDLERVNAVTLAPRAQQLAADFVMGSARALEDRGHSPRQRRLLRVRRQLR